MNQRVKILLGFLSLWLASSAWADLVIPMHLVSKKGVGDFIGTVTVKQTQYGLLFTPNLHGLPPGPHGFHIHQNPACGDNGMAAGGHWLGVGTEDEHLGPYQDEGHQGDLPVLIVDKNGKATVPELAPRIKDMSAIKNHSLIIHEHGDNYSDKPEKLGGGGPRIACGIIK